MDVLNNTKTQVKEVSVKLVEAEQKTKEINEKRDQYRMVAIRGSVLYFCMVELSNVNWVYNSSLNQFLGLFDQSIDLAEKNNVPGKRVENITKFLTSHVYHYVNRGLFEKDKTTFLLIVCFKILVTSGKIINPDVGVLLKAGAGLDEKTERQNPFTWLPNKEAWLNCLAISRHHFANDSLAFFRELPDSLARNENAWKQWVDRNDPENYPIPDFAERISTEKDIGPFLSLCMIRALREDRTLVASSQFIGSILGKDFTAPNTYSIEKIWQESTQFEPILFLLSAGADPSASIDDWAKKRRKYPCDKISMGEGQERIALQSLQTAFEAGSWVVLQNCHLGLGFMKDLINIISPETPIHEEFRLWITAEPNNEFPLGMLQKAIKVTNEPPKGLKASLNKTFNTVINQDLLEKIEHPSWRSLIYTTCFLHSVVIERKKYGPLGWCIPYEYNYSDLEASLAFMEKYLTNLTSGMVTATQNLPINVTVIKYMVCDVQYGGRITDDLDRELFKAYGDDYYTLSIFGTGEHVLAEGPVEGSSGIKEKFKYKIPHNPANEVIKYREYVEFLPGVDSPEVFGLHANADLTFRKKESNEMIDTIAETRPKEASGGAGKTLDEIAQEKAREILSKIPPDYIDSDVRDQIKKLPGPKQLNDRGLTVPLNIFLYQEIQRMQRVIGLVRKSLIDSIDAIDGQIIMTPIILDVINSLADLRVPSIWIYDATGVEISWLIANLGTWVSSLTERNNQLNSWLRNNRPNTFWLTGFFNPQGFLTGMQQEVTRMHKPKPGEKEKDVWSLDDVVYHTQVKEKEYEMIKDIQPEGVYIHGLILEGCRYSKNGLEDSKPKEMFFELPILYVTAVHKKKSPDTEKLSSTYMCPVYKYRKRTDKYIIFKVGLPCEGAEEQHKWKLRGVALLCSKE